MRRLWLKTVIIASFIAATGDSVLAAPPAPIWSWTGYYVGANVGYSWGRSNSTVDFKDAASGALLSSATAKADLDGVIGGGQFGYNWQHRDWLFGFEADIQGSAQKGSATAACAGGSLGAPPASLFSACAPGHIGTYSVHAVLVSSRSSPSLSLHLEPWPGVSGRKQADPCPQPASRFLALNSTPWRRRRCAGR